MWVRICTLHKSTWLSCLVPERTISLLWPPIASTHAYTTPDIYQYLSSFSFTILVGCLFRHHMYVYKLIAVFTPPNASFYSCFVELIWIWQKRRDSNPRTAINRLTVFETVPFGLLGTLPYIHVLIIHKHSYLSTKKIRHSTNVGRIDFELCEQLTSIFHCFIRKSLHISLSHKVFIDLNPTITEAMIIISFLSTKKIGIANLPWLTAINNLE